MYVRDYTFFFSSTDMALASLRNIALPQRSSRKLVNWWYFHLRKAEAASWNSLSVQLLSASNNGLTEMQAITRQNSQRSQAIRIGRRLISITGMCYVLSTRAIDSSNVACNQKTFARSYCDEGRKRKVMKTIRQIWNVTQLVEHGPIDRGIATPKSSSRTKSDHSPSFHTHRKYPPRCCWNLPAYNCYT